MRIPIISGESPEGRFPINIFFMPAGFNGRDQMSGTPGLIEYCDTGIGSEVRGAIRFSVTVSYWVVGNTVVKVEQNGVKTNLAATLDSSSGHVWMEKNYTQVMIVDGANGYVIAGDVVTKITDVDFPTPSSLTYQDGYGIVTKKDTDDFYISALYDFTSWNALDFAAAEGAPDVSRATFMEHRELWNFGDDSTEIFYNSGDADFPFERAPGGFIELGIGAKASPAKIDNSVFWLASDFTIRRAAEGYLPVVISPPQLNKIIGAYTVKSDAQAYTFPDHQGNSFYVLTFPTEGVTWAYNAASRFWHQWAGGVSQARHRSNCFVFFDGYLLVGDYSNGKIYRLDYNAYTDDGTVIKWTRTTPAIFGNNRERIFFPYLEVEFKVGVGLTTGQGSDPQVMMRYSDTGMKTWSSEKWRSIGKIGEYTTRVRWSKLGSARNRIFEISGTDPVERAIVGAYSDPKGGNI